jgi:hypothetical protein
MLQQAAAPDANYYSTYDRRRESRHRITSGCHSGGKASGHAKRKTFRGRNCHERSVKTEIAGAELLESSSFPLRKPLLLCCCWRSGRSGSFRRNRRGGLRSGRRSSLRGSGCGLGFLRRLGSRSRLLGRIRRVGGATGMIRSRSIRPLCPFARGTSAARSRCRTRSTAARIVVIAGIVATVMATPSCVGVPHDQQRHRRNNSQIHDSCQHVGSSLEIFAPRLAIQPTTPG